MANDSNVVRLIRERAIASGVDPDVLTRIATVESGLDPNARARTSTATGLFQFVQPTWRTWGAGADPRDPYANADAGARFTAANVQGLRAAGLDPTPGNTYLAHFAGLGGARKVLGSSDATPVADVLDPAAIRANPFLARMTVGDLRAWADQKMGGAPATAARSAGTSPVPSVAGGPSQTGQVPVDPENAAGPDDQLLRTLQILSSPAEAPARSPTPALRLDTGQQQERIRRARALAVAMATQPIT